MNPEECNFERHIVETKGNLNSQRKQIDSEKATEFHASFKRQCVSEKQRASERRVLIVPFQHQVFQEVSSWRSNLAIALDLL